MYDLCIAQITSLLTRQHNPRYKLYLLLLLYTSLSNGQCIAICPRSHSSPTHAPNLSLYLTLSAAPTNAQSQPITALASHPIHSTAVPFHRRKTKPCTSSHILQGQFNPSPCTTCRIQARPTQAHASAASLWQGQLESKHHQPHSSTRTTAPFDAIVNSCCK